MSAAPKRPHLFVIAPEVRRAMSPAEVAAICHDLKELDLFRLPYEDCTVRLLADDIIRWVGNDGATPPPTSRLAHSLGPSWVLDIGPLSLDGAGTVLTLRDLSTGVITDSASDPLMMTRGADPIATGRSTTDMLIALLATRNVVKSTREHKLAKFGIGKKKNRFAYTTTISLPRAEDIGDDADHPPPVFVNADEDFVAIREAYNVIA